MHKRKVLVKQGGPKCIPSLGIGQFCRLPSATGARCMQEHFVHNRCFPWVVALEPVDLPCVSAGMTTQDFKHVGTNTN